MPKYFTRQIKRLLEQICVKCLYGFLIGGGNLGNKYNLKPDGKCIFYIIFGHVKFVHSLHINHWRGKTDFCNTLVYAVIFSKCMLIFFACTAVCLCVRQN